MTTEEHALSSNTDCLGLFAKYWEPGRVKTRLAQSLGNEKAARIYEAFVAATVARLSAVHCTRVLSYWPDDAKTRSAFESAAALGWALVPQTEGDLGERMAGYFFQQFSAGVERVVLLGTDSPNVPLVEVQEAFEHLKTVDVVLGPTDDGGYYLVGAANRVPPIFGKIPWSTPEVLPRTIACLEEEGFSFATLDPWYDVDEIYDLHRLIEDLRDECEAEPPLQVLLKHVLEVIES